MQTPLSFLRSPSLCSTLIFTTLISKTRWPKINFYETIAVSGAQNVCHFLDESHVLQTKIHLVIFILVSTMPSPKRKSNLSAKVTFSEVQRGKAILRSFLLRARGLSDISFWRSHVCIISRALRMTNPTVRQWSLTVHWTYFRNYRVGKFDRDQKWVKAVHPKH